VRGHQPHHLRVLNVTEICEPKRPGTLWTTPVLLRDSFTFLPPSNYMFLNIVTCKIISVPFTFKFTVCPSVREIVQKTNWIGTRPSIIESQPIQKPVLGSPVAMRASIHKHTSSLDASKNWFWVFLNVLGELYINYEVTCLRFYFNPLGTARPIP
jgi:hypothetical protein